MNTKEATQQWHTQQTEKGNIAYFPFLNEEKVQEVVFDKPINATIRVVEESTPLSQGEVSNQINLGLVKTHCLIVECNEQCEVTVLTIN